MMNIDAFHAPEASHAPTIRCVLLQLPKMNASVSTNWSKTGCCNIRSLYVCRRQYYRRELSIPSRILSMVVGARCRTPMLGAVVLFCLNDFVHQGGAPLESLAMVQLLCLSFQDDALESMPMRTHKTIICELAIWVQMPAFITI